VPVNPAPSVSVIGTSGITLGYGTNSDLFAIYSPAIVSTTAVTATTAKADVLRIETGGEPQTLNDATHGQIVFPRKAGSLLLLKFWGQGADNATASGQVWLWHGVKKAGTTNPTTATPEQWHPTLLCTFSLVVGQKTGVSGGLIGTSDRYADTITVTSDRSLQPNLVRVMTPTAADNGSVTLAIDPLNAPLIEVELVNGTTTAVNFGASWVSS